MIRFRSKISIGILLFICAIVVPVMIMSIVDKVLPVLIILSALVIFILSICLFTCYVITSDNKLVVRCGLIYKKTITIDAIYEISPTNNAISAPALSLDRLMIRYKYSMVIISPKNKSQFINELLIRNPSIKFEPTPPL